MASGGFTGTSWSVDSTPLGPGQYDMRATQTDAAGNTGVLEVVATRRKLGSTTNEIFVIWSLGSAVVTLGIAVIFGAFIMGMIMPRNAGLTDAQYRPVLIGVRADGRQVGVVLHRGALGQLDLEELALPDVLDGRVAQGMQRLGDCGPLRVEHRRLEGHEHARSHQTATS